MAKIKYINRVFDNDTSAGKFQNKLYKQYNNVKCIKATIEMNRMFYTWEVSGPIKNQKSK